MTPNSKTIATRFEQHMQQSLVPLVETLIASADQEIYSQPVIVDGHTAGKYIMMHWSRAAELLQIKPIKPPSRSHEYIHLLIDDRGLICRTSFSSEKGKLPILAQYFVSILQQEYADHGFVTIYNLRKYYDNKYQIERRITEIGEAMQIVNVRGLGYLPPGTVAKDRFVYLQILAHQIFQDCLNGQLDYEIKYTSRSIENLSFSRINLQEGVLPKADGDIYRIYLLNVDDTSFPIILSPLEYQLFELLFANYGYTDRAIWKNSGYQTDATTLRIAAQKLNQKLTNVLNSSEPLVFSDGLGYHLQSNHRNDFLAKQELAYLGQQVLTAISYLDIDRLNSAVETVLPRRVGDSEPFVFVQISNRLFTVNIELPASEFAVVEAFAKNRFRRISTNEAVPETVEDFKTKRRVFRTAFINLVTRLGTYFELPEAKDLIEWEKNLNYYSFPLLSKPMREG